MVGISRLYLYLPTVRIRNFKQGAITQGNDNANYSIFNQGMNKVPMVMSKWVDKIHWVNLPCVELPWLNQTNI